MFQRLQQKWNVEGLQLILILCTFAIGGSLTGFTGKKIMNLFFIDQRWLWLVIYIIIVTVIWPFAVLLVSVPFGQYRFFTKYLQKMGKKMGIISQSSEVRSPIINNRQEAMNNPSTSSGATGNPLTTHHSLM